MQRQDEGEHFGDAGENDQYGSSMHEDHPGDERNHPDQRDKSGPAEEPVQDRPEPSHSGNIQDGSMLQAALIHLSGLVGFYFTAIVIANILAPLLLWLIWKNGSKFMDTQGKEALNFQLSMTLYTILSIPLLFLCMIGVIPLLLVALAEIIFPIIAAISAWNGETFSYPLTIRFVE